MDDKQKARQVELEDSLVRIIAQIQQLKRIQEITAKQLIELEQNHVREDGKYQEFCSLMGLDLKAEWTKAQERINKEDKKEIPVEAKEVKK